MITVRRDAVRTQGRQHSCRNAQVVLASTVVTGRNSSVLKVSFGEPRGADFCQHALLRRPTMSAPVLVNREYIKDGRLRWQ